MIYNDYNEDIFIQKVFRYFPPTGCKEISQQFAKTFMFFFFANEHIFLFPTLPTWCLLQLAMEKHLKKCVKWKVSNGKTLEKICEICSKSAIKTTE